MSAAVDTMPGDEDLDLIEAALDTMMTFEDWQLSDDLLLQQMDRLGVIGDRIHGLRLAKIRVADDRGSCPEVGSYATSDRITLTDRTAPATAKHHVKTARELRRYPTLQKAAERGWVTREQLTAVLLGLRWIPDTAAEEDLTVIQKELIEYAASHPPHSMRRLVNKLVAVHFPDAEDDRLNDQLERGEHRARQQRSLTWKLDGEGSLFVRIKLPLLDGEKLQHVVTAFMTRPVGLDLQLDPDAEQPSLDQRRADAFVSMLEQFFHPHTGPDNDTDAGPASGLSTPSGPSEPSGPSSGGGGVPPNVSIILDFEDLVAGTGTGTLVDSDEPISAAAARRLACAANLIPIVLGRNGEILDVGKAHRLVTPAIRKALTVRDRGCVFPGCDVAPHHCDAHHVIPWHAGGNTGLANLVLVCRHHHRIVEPKPTCWAGSPMDDHLRPARHPLDPAADPTRPGPHTPPQRSLRGLTPARRLSSLSRPPKAEGFRQAQPTEVDSTHGSRLNPRRTAQPGRTAQPTGPLT